LRASKTHADAKPSAWHPARSPVDGGKGFTTYFIDKKAPLNKLFEQHLLKNVNDRWDWIQGAAWVDWKAFLAQPLNRPKWVKSLDHHLPEAERQYFGPQP
jgi:hypothetical protein